MRIAVATKVIDYFEHKQQQKKTENEQLNLPSFEAQSQHSSTNNGTEQNSKKSPPTSRQFETQSSGVIVAYAEQCLIREIILTAPVTGQTK